MQLSVVIVSWNVCALLKQCIESVLSDVRPGEFEIIVVDNASSDGTIQMLATQFPDIQLIENSENIGFGRANNQGIQKSKGRYILILNPDTEIRSWRNSSHARISLRLIRKLAVWDRVY